MALCDVVTHGTSSLLTKLVLQQNPKFVNAPPITSASIANSGSEVTVLLFDKLHVLSVGKKGIDQKTQVPTSPPATLAPQPL